MSLALGESILTAGAVDALAAPKPRRLDARQAGRHRQHRARNLVTFRKTPSGTPPSETRRRQLCAMRVLPVALAATGRSPEQGSPPAAPGPCHPPPTRCPTRPRDAGLHGPGFSRGRDALSVERERAARWSPTFPATPGTAARREPFRLRRRHMQRYSSRCFATECFEIAWSIRQSRRRRRHHRRHRRHAGRRRYG
jgi:hypothetical protein